MLFTSPVYSQASGSIAGIVYSHNRGGMYTRARSTPTDPGSARQQALRTAMATLAPYWGETLTEAERDAWRNYGDNVAMTNALGETTYHTGQQHFMRCNLPRLQASIAILETAPTNYDLGSFTAPAFYEINPTNDTSISFTNTDDWAGDATGYMLCYHGNPQGAGINFYKGPWKYAGKVQGDSVTPPTSPHMFTSPVPQAEDQKIWCMMRFIQLDGRYSSPIILGPEVVVV